MSRKWFRYIDGEVRELNTNPEYVFTPFVHEDTMPPLKHPKTGEIVNSRTRWNAINKTYGLKEVGNDLMSKAPERKREVLTEERISDAIERAEAICSDPSKFRARMNYERELAEKAERSKHFEKLKVPYYGVR